MSAGYYLRMAAWLALVLLLPGGVLLALFVRTMQAWWQRRERGWTLVVLESPYAGNIVRNMTYARACVRDCLDRREAPFASHLLYTQPGVFDDAVAAERAQGIAAGLAWGRRAAKTVVYADLGVTAGMLRGVADANAAGRPVEYRSLPAYRTAAATPAVTPIPAINPTPSQNIGCS